MTKPTSTFAKCSYGMSCYRKNVQHFREESHPAEHAKAELVAGFLVDEMNTDIDSDYDDEEGRSQSKTSCGKRKASTQGKAKATPAGKGKAKSSAGKGKSQLVVSHNQNGIESLLVRFRRAVLPLLEQTTKAERGSRASVKAGNKLQLGYSKRALHSSESGGYSTPAKHSQGMGLNSGSTKLGKLEGGDDFMGLCSELLRAADPVSVPSSEASPAILAARVFLSPLSRLVTLAAPAI
jgi:hypothetical protein